MDSISLQVVGNIQGTGLLKKYYMLQRSKIIINSDQYKKPSKHGFYVLPFYSTVRQRQCVTFLS